MATIQNALTFHGFNVTNVVFERPLGFNNGEFSINIEHLAQVNAEDKSYFQAIFIVTLTDKDSKFNLQVKATADFQVIGEVPQEIYDSFVNVNAPAIAYPYLRAFVSNLVMQAGMNPIIIPPLNFMQPQNKKEIQE